MRRLAVIFLSASLLASSSPALAQALQAASVPGSSLRVIDGDTVRYGRLRLRIENLDAPDIGDHARCALEAQRGRASKAYAEGLLRGRQVQIQPAGRTDRYGRELVRLSIGGRDFGQSMISAGHGRPWRGRSSDWCGS